ncbi:hypothetical protein [Saccharothrix variisporea]|uniref:Uncharacterized protein n=1 Tax=Saccharothrix variisporea TaxID=543527 RepID=A0A495XIF6_9PSEU|nr:hypothetical protein [Saccharothrix variisporea]RKT72905.1 hypothetical protein DFJ66_6229 [Saccharothrix variisporea]
MTENPFRLTDDERRQGYALLADFTASLLLGPLGPFAVLAGRYLYDRRDAIFDRLGGRPARAFDATGRPHGLSTLSTGALSTLAVRPVLTDAARGLGLREGDPVSLVLTGQRFTSARSGLVVPARIGQRVEVSVPEDTYSLGAFAGRAGELFTRAHPFRVAGGQAVTASGRSGMVLNLDASPALRPGGTTPRNPAAARWWTAGPTGLLSPRPTPPGGLVSPRPTPPGGLRFPRESTGGPVVPRPASGPRFDRPTGVRQSATACWWCGAADNRCDCLIGAVRRFWNG